MKTLLLLSMHVVVFGKVVEGMPVVKRIEVCGARSGKPTKKVQITDCGQLPGRMEMLLRLKQEKEEMAKLRADPLQVDPDAEARKRLAEIRGEAPGQGKGPSSAAAQGTTRATETEPVGGVDVA